MTGVGVKGYRLYSTGEENKALKMTSLAQVILLEGRSDWVTPLVQLRGALPLSITERLFNNGQGQGPVCVLSSLQDALCSVYLQAFFFTHAVLSA